MTCRVMIVDDNPVIRAGLSTVLDLADDLEVVGEAADGQSAIELVRRVRPDVVLLDVMMPGVDGVTAAAELSRHSQVVMLTQRADAATVRAALDNGAAGYLVHNDFTMAELTAAIRDAAGRRARPMSPDAVSALDAARPAGGLSAREAEIMELVAQGYSNAAIGGRLFISDKTVKNHLNHIYAKLRVRGRVAAVVTWLDRARAS